MIGGMFILFLVLLLLNVPIAFSLGASSLFYLLTSNMNAAVLAQKFYAGIDSFTLLCIPGFMLAGALMNGGGITRRILNFCNAFLGHFTGSLALVNIVASMVFAGISGTAIADVCSLGGMLIPAMVEDGYDDDFSVAVTAASSVVGPIIPPSVPMVIAGSCVSISVGKMFQASSPVSCWVWHCVYPPTLSRSSATTPSTSVPAGRSAWKLPKMLSGRC